MRWMRRQEQAQEVQQDWAARGAQIGASVGSLLGEKLGLTAERTALSAGVAATRTREGASSTAASARAGRDRLGDRGLAGTLQDARAGLAPLGEVLEGVLEDARGRSVDAARSVTGRPAPRRQRFAVAVPMARRLTGRQQPRRWPVALGAVVLGAAVGAGAVLIRRSLLGSDAPGAQDPDQVKAVVDVLPPGTTAAPSRADLPGADGSSSAGMAEPISPP